MGRRAAIVAGAAVLGFTARPACADMLPGKYETSSAVMSESAKQTGTLCLTASDIDAMKASLDKGLNPGTIAVDCTVRDFSAREGRYSSDYACRGGPAGERHMEAVMTDTRLDITDTAPLSVDGQTVKFGYSVSFRRIGDCD